MHRLTWIKPPNRVLELSLYEEKENDDLLIALAENYINAKARRE